MSDSNKTKNVKLGAPIGVIRQQLLEDADTISIAKAFKIPIEKYVDMVLSYAKNPDREPQLTILDEEEMQVDGADLPTQEDVLEWFGKVESGEIDLGPGQGSKDVMEKSSKASGPSKYTNLTPASANSAPVSDPFVSGASPKASADSGSVLKRQLQNQRAQANIKAGSSNKKKQNP